MKLGVFFWSENCLWSLGGFRGDGNWFASAYPTNSADEPEFEASVKASLRDMIRIHRNHPSVIVWSMSNEPFFTPDPVMPKLRKFLAELVAYSHELDPTRPAAIGGCQRGEIDKLGDIAGYNGDGASLPEYQNPGIPSMVSEYGSTVTHRPGTYAPGWGDLALTPGAIRTASVPGVCRGAAARPSGAASTTAAFAAGPGSWASWITSACRSGLVLVSQRIPAHPAARLARQWCPGRAEIVGGQDSRSTPPMARMTRISS